MPPTLPPRDGCFGRAVLCGVEVEVVEVWVAVMGGEVDGALTAVLGHERVAVQFGQPRREHRPDELPQGGA
jgi:hypothetical protein